MIYFNKTQIEALKELEDYFNTSVNHNYKRTTNRKQNELVEQVYKEATGIDLNTNFNCPKCTFNTFVKVGRVYFESIERLGFAKESNPEENKEPEAEAVTNTELTTQEKRVLALQKAREAKKNKNKK